MKLKFAIAFLLLTTYLSAETIDVDRLITAGEHWISIRFDKQLTYKSHHNIAGKTSTPVYAVNFEPQGFMIIAGDYNLPPVIGYSESGYAGGEPIPPQLVYLLSDLIKSPSGSSGNVNKISSAWNDFLNYTGSSTLNKERVVKSIDPLLNTKWGQGKYYNEKCPTDVMSTAGNEHVWTGCVATAIAQILRYNEYPPKGYGSNSYYSESYGTISADFSGTEYNWNMMPDKLNENSTPDEIDEVANLMYQCGVAVNMQYSPAESSANSLTVLSVLKKYFSYSFFMSGLSYSSMTNAVWLDNIKNEIDLKRPLYYGVYDDTRSTGHAFVCDGYDENNYLHCNWGWNGNYNGYYSIWNMAPSGYNFSSQHYVIGGIIPVKRIESNTLFAGENIIDISLELEANLTLTILPGSTIKFGNGNYILTRGNIDCTGTPQDSILLIPTEKSTSWGGIIQQNVSSSTLNSNFNYTIVKNADAASRSLINNQTKNGGWLSSIGDINLQIEHCRFINCSALNGGALYFSSPSNYNSNLQIEHCRFINCSAINGGALYFSSPSNYNSKLKLFNVQFVNNFAQSGASFYINPVKSLEVNNCQFVQNEAGISDIISIFGSDILDIEGSDFIDNKAPGTGVINLNKVRFATLRSINYLNNISDNTSLIYTSGGDSLFIENSGFFNNTVSSTGIINANSQKYSSLTNNSFIYNNYNDDAVDILLSNVDSSNIYNSLFLNDYPDNRIINVAGDGLYLDFSFNYTQSESFSKNFDGYLKYRFNITGNPGITMHQDGTYSLNDQSVCINRGSPATKPSYLYDKAGNPRKTGSTIDIGSIEFPKVLIKPAFDVYPKDSIKFSSLTGNKIDFPLEILNIDNPSLTLDYKDIKTPFEVTTSQDTTNIILSVSSISPGVFRDTLNIVSNISTISIPLKADIAYNKYLSGTWKDETVNVYDNITVLSDDTLKISGNTKVVFNDSFQLVIKGTLIVDGDVTFTTSDKDKLWKGIMFVDNTSNSSIKGATLKRVSPDYDIIKMHNAANIEISECTFDSLLTRYIIYSTGSDNITIKDCKFSNSESYYCYFAGGSNIRIESNSFSNSNLGGVWIRNGWNEFNLISNRFDSVNTALWISRGKSGRVINNLFTNCERSVYCIGDSSTYINNTFVFDISESNYDDFKRPIMIREKAAPSFFNCIFSDNDENSNSSKGYISILKPSNADFYNCCIKDGFSRILVNAEYNFTGNYYGIITDAPLFTNDTYLLSEYSKCIDAGTTNNISSFLPGTDLAGNPRLIHRQIDIGAFEYDGELLPNPQNYPTDFKLFQNYPNPVNSETLIRYEIPTKKHVNIDLYNILGEKIESLVDAVLEPGEYSINLSTSGLSSGVYFYRVHTNSYSDSKKLVILK